MPTVMKPSSHAHRDDTHRAEGIKKRNFAQTTTIALGCILFLLSLCGILMPSFAGLHLSVIHATSLGACGVLAIWAGSQDILRKTFLTDIGLGIFFAFHALAGFLLGSPGQPGVGYEAMDPLLVKIMPGFNELGLHDHVLHTILMFGFFLAASFIWRHYRRFIQRT